MVVVDVTALLGASPRTRQRRVRRAIEHALLSRPDEKTLGIRLLSFAEASDRRLGADLLVSYLRRERRPTRDVAHALVASLQTEDVPAVLAALLEALSRDPYPPAFRVIQRFLEHPNARVRFSATAALAACVGRGRAAIPRLIRLTTDRDARVRDWACFGLREAIDEFDHRDADILEALAARLGDRDADVRGEAMLGLTLAGDPRGRIAFDERRAQGQSDDYMDDAAEALDPDGG